MEIKAIEVKGKDAYLINNLDRRNEVYLLNGEPIDESLLNTPLKINRTDRFQKISKSKVLKHYQKGETILTVEEFKSKPTYYDNDSSAEWTLRAIANRKDLEGFEPIYADPEPEDIDFKVIGYLEDTGSDCITSHINFSRIDFSAYYMVDIHKTTVSEYEKCKIEYQRHAVFETLRYNYLRFAKINNSYAFPDVHPFRETDRPVIYRSLEEAHTKEKEIRELTRKHINKMVFPKNITAHKQFTIIDILHKVIKLKTLKSKDELLKVLIEDLNEYKNNIEL